MNLLHPSSLTPVTHVAAHLTGNASVVGWVCLVLGVLLVVAGAGIGLYLNMSEPGRGGAGGSAKDKISSALSKTVELKTEAKTAAASTTPEPEKAAAADTAASGIESVLKELDGMVGALPERLRFSGLLVLLGALLISVATVQFGGHAVF